MPSAGGQGKLIREPRPSIHSKLPGSIFTGIHLADPKAFLLLPGVGQDVIFGAMMLSLDLPGGGGAFPGWGAAFCFGIEYSDFSAKLRRDIRPVSQIRSREHRA